MLKNSATLKGRILWADDEIEHLKPHILFLEERGYTIRTVTNGEDAVALAGEEPFDLVLLDEMMHGMDGLRALAELKSRAPALPVIMITKSEQEDIMERAIGGNIEEYLTKPVNPSQILSSCKRILEKRRIERDRLTREYTREFSEITRMLGQSLTPSDWIGIHQILSEREIELDEHPDLGLSETIASQRRECNIRFGQYIAEEYPDWMRGEEAPLLSPDLVKEKIVPSARKKEPVALIVIDNLRLDQWLVMEPLLYNLFTIKRGYYFSILPTATPYSRNSIFSGLYPADIEAEYPDLWKEAEDDETSLNRQEASLFSEQLRRCGCTDDLKIKYIKVLEAEEARRLAANSSEYLEWDVTALVFNFVDIVAHKRSESQILKEIVPDEAAYRSLTRSWFKHSHLLTILRAFAEAGRRVIITSDHGSIRVRRGLTVHADRETSTSLRYKQGRNIRGEGKLFINITDPAAFRLPRRGINTNYLIAREDGFFLYPTNHHHYLNLYRDSLQHGGISLEEMILPLVELEARE